MYLANKQLMGWLSSFLKCRGLQAPDGRSLHDYHCSHEEYYQLLSYLRLFNPTSSSKDKTVSAGFVFFCSEWYRREYQSKNGWSWEAIWTVLGFELQSTELSSIVPKGLEDYWQRPLHRFESGGRNFLGSLFAEGGLPLQVLQEDGSRFKSFFERLLKQGQQAQILGYNSIQLVELSMESAGLPQVFSSAHSVLLIAQMVDQLQGLVFDFDLDKTTDPAAKLDEVNPKWRELFPLPLDNETGTKLLNGLLQTAKDAGGSRRKSGGWEAKHFWSELAPNSIKAQVSMPSEVVFKLTTQPSTTRLELVLYEGDKPLVNLGPGYAVIDEHSAKVRLRHREVSTERQILDVALRLVAVAGGVVIASIDIPWSSIAFGDVPIGFEPSGERWLLCGQASFTTASEQVLLVLPNNSVIKAASEIDLVVIKQVSPVANLQAFKVQGKASLKVEFLGDESGEDSDIYKVKTGYVAGSALGLDLHGTQLDWPTNPALSFVGLPRPYFPVGAVDLNSSGTSLYISGKLAGSGFLQEALGTHFVSVRNRQGESLLRRKVGVLPSDFKVELRGGASATEGSIWVYTKQRCVFQVAAEGVETKQNKGEGYTELKLVADNLPPISISLIVRPSLIADPITIELPFPSSGCLAFDVTGKPLGNDLCVDELLGTRFYLFGHGGIATNFTIELSLRGDIAKNAYYRWNYKVGSKPVEIDLYSLREQIVDLLSLDSSIDQLVQLHVSGSGRDTFYRIRRYSTLLRMDQNWQLLTANNRFGESSHHLPKLELMLLHEPLRRTVSLNSRVSEGVPTGEFELPLAVEKDGPWLVVPAKNSLVSFRPLFIAGGKDFSPLRSEIKSLQKAVQAFEPNSAVCCFTAVLDAMASNPMHSGWQFLRALYDRFSYLPLTTFEVWKALFRHPKALALALFKFEMDPGFLERIEAEFPVLWEFFPVLEIQKATTLYSGFLQEKGIQKQSVVHLVSRMVSRLGAVFPSYGENAQRFLCSKPIGPEMKLPKTHLSAVVHGWYRELIRDRSEAQWPEFGGKKLEHWHKVEADSLINFQPEMDYRYAVVYFPVFAAAVASGKANFNDMFFDTNEAVFFLRQIRDFDSKWFDSIYEISLLINLESLV